MDKLSVKLPPDSATIEVNPGQKNQDLREDGERKSQNSDINGAKLAATVPMRTMQHMPSPRLNKTGVIGEEPLPEGIDVQATLAELMRNMVMDDEFNEQMEKIESPNRVQLSISCRNLINTDNFSKSDPYALLLIKTEKEKKWQKVGQTETSWNDLNPDFTTTFNVNYFFEKKQILRIEIYDYNETNPVCMGLLDLPLNRLLTANKQMVRDVLKTNHGKQAGKIIVRADTVADSNHEVDAKIFCKLVPKHRKRWNFACCRSYPDNPIMLIQRQDESDEEQVSKWLNVFQTEVLYMNSEPFFKKFSIKMQLLCKSRRGMPLRFIVYS